MLIRLQMLLYAFLCFSQAFIRFHTLSYAFIRFHTLSYAFIPIIYALIRFYMHSTCYNMLLKAKVSQQQEEMMLALCITGFCFAEAGKNVLRCLLLSLEIYQHTKLFTAKYNGKVNLFKDIRTSVFQTLSTLPMV